MRKARKRDNTTTAELDITAFMNLMIVLVPVLLLNMVFTHIRVLDLQLPELKERIENTSDQDEKHLEIVIQKDLIKLNYPAGQALKSFSKAENEYPFEKIKAYLKQVKSTFQNQGLDRKEIIILLEPNIPYQVLVQTMDTVKSYPAVVANSVVEAELFPNVSLGDAT